MNIALRPARPSDVDRAVPLIYSSGPDAFDYVFGAARSFLTLAFLDGQGEFGYGNHTIAEVDGSPIAIGAAYSGETSMRFMLAAMRQILRHYGPAGPAVMFRGLRAEQVIPPPPKGTQYIAHLGVHPDFRGRGVGAMMISRFLDAGRLAGHRTAQLDVAVTNPDAQRLYERIGFTVTDEHQSRLSNEFGVVVNHRRMVLEL